jgi:hypothetical protein
MCEKYVQQIYCISHSLPSRHRTQKQAPSPSAHTVTYKSEQNRHAELEQLFLSEIHLFARVHRL